MGIGIAFFQSDETVSPANLNWTHNGTGTNADMRIRRNGVTLVPSTNAGSGSFAVIIGDEINVFISKAIVDGTISERLIVKENAITIENQVDPAPIDFTFNITMNVLYEVLGSTEPT